MDESYEFYVAGVKFQQLNKCINEIKEGDKLDLIPEPENTYDSNAVRIEYKQTMLGYVPAKFSASVNALIIVDNPACIVTEINPQAKTWEQLKVKIS